jgi:hypothetical protein
MNEEMKTAKTQNEIQGEKQSEMPKKRMKRMKKNNDV